MSKVVAICQPNFMPWLGYFEMGSRADIYVMLDDVQFVSGEWMNRNRIRRSGDPDGWQWITVPVCGKSFAPITGTSIDYSRPWGVKMKKSITQAYANAPHADWCLPELFRVLEERHASLAELNIALIKEFYRLLGMRDNIVRSSDLQVGGTRESRLVQICKTLDADIYLANNGSAPYIDRSVFYRSGIGFCFQNYDHPPYPQKNKIFQPFLSVIDLMCMCGSVSLDVICSTTSKDWKGAVSFTGGEL